MLSAESLAEFSARVAWPDRARTWEVVGWSAVLAVAGVLRLASLGDRPLGPDEAQPALAAWRMWLQHAPADTGGGVLLLHTLAASFGMFGASDVVARLPTVVAGLALVAAPLLLRPVVGPAAALAAGALLALSPMQVFGSRHVDAAIFVPALLALLVGVCARAVLAAPEVGRLETALDDAAAPSPQPSPRGRGGLALSPPSSGRVAAWQWWAYAVPVLLALLLTAGSVAIPALLAVVGAAVVTWWPTRGAEGGGAPESGAQGVEAHGARAAVAPGQESGRAAADAPASPGRAGRLPRPSEWLAMLPLAALDWRLVAALFGGTLVLVGTAGLMNLRGLQGALAEPWVSWLAPYYPRATPIPWLPTLLVYDLPLVAVGLAGIAVVIRRNRPFEHFLLWWTTLAALPLVFQPPDPLPYLLCWLLPFALLGGLALGSQTGIGWTWRTLGEDLVLAALAGVTFVCAVNTLRLAQSGLAGPAGLGGRGREVLLSLAVLGFLAAMNWRLREWWGAVSEPGEASRPLRVSTIVALVLGLAFVGVTNGRLQYADYDAGGAELLRPQALSPNVYNIVDELQTWARQEPSSPIIVGEALKPLLLWHLRDVPTVRFQDEFPDALHTPPGQVRRGLWPAGPGAPEGERQPLDEAISVGPIPSTGALWNWWLYRNSWLVPTRHDIIVVR